MHILKPKKFKQNHLSVTVTLEINLMVCLNQNAEIRLGSLHRQYGQEEQ